MRIEINLELCDSHGQCVAAAPDVFAFGPTGELVVLVETVTDGQAEAVEEAATLCPVQAISLS